MIRVFTPRFKELFKVMFMSALLATTGLVVLPNAQQFLHSSTVTAYAATKAHAAANAKAVSSNPIVLENQQQGSSGWQFDNYNKASNHEIEGYASLTSVNQGGTISFMVSLSSNDQFSMDFYRMGYYPNGTNPDGTACSGPCGGRLMLHVASLSGSKQAACPKSPSGADIGMIECHWTPSYTLQVPTSWTTGNYIVKLSRNSNGLENYITFVVRSDGAAADIVYSMDVTTWQAYNFWSGAGNNDVGASLYGTFNDSTLAFISNTRAYTVSFDRPYLDQGSIDGAGNFMVWDYPMIRWMESQGYNVTYVTDVDLESNANLFQGRKVFMNTGHDEYYSDNMRNAIKNAINSGINMAFFSANNIGYRVQWQNSSSGAAYREIHCDKGATSGSTTTWWRYLTPPEPENALVGVMQNGVASSRPYLVYNASNWIYAGSGLSNYNGTVITKGSNQNAISGLIGYEFDERAANDKSLASFVSFEPSGIQQVGHSNVPASDNGVAAFSDATLYTVTSGATVFAAGTIQWSWGVDNGVNDGFCDCNQGYASTPAQKITANILNKFIGTVTAVPVASLNPTSLSFGNQNVGTTSASQAITLTNSGSAALSISSIALQGTNASAFAQTNNCPTSLAAGSTCTINVTFTPGASGAMSASVAVTDNASGSPQTVALSGTGVTSAPGVSFSPTSLSFGNQNVGTTSASQAITLTNSGNAALSISGIALQGTNASAFAQTNNCPTSLAASSSCTINVTFTPSASGAMSASVAVTDNAAGSPQTVALSGTGVTAGTYFSDGFESGNLSKWNFDPTSTGTAVVENTVVHSGTYAAALTNNTSGNVAMTAPLSGGAQTLTYTRFYFRENLSGSGMIAMAENVNTNFLWIVLYDANLKGIDVYFISNGVTYTISSASNSISPNTWYSVEVELNSTATGTGQVWLNGTSIGSVSANLATATPYTKLLLYGEAIGTEYFDDVVVSNTYNGL